MTNPPNEREILAGDTFRAEPAPSQPERLYALEFIADETGERRTVELDRPMSESEAVKASAEHRKAGEVFLQLVPR